MPSIILSDNGVSSGSAGLKSTAASDGALALQTTTAGGIATTAVYVDTSQNVGIGTSSPSTQLHLYKNAVGAANLFLENASSSAGAYATVQFNAGTVTSQLFSDAGGGVYAQSAVLRTTSNHPLIFGTNSTERARFNAGAPILCLSGGNTSATGTGIAFPATQSASSDANTLDDYEEGTWSPSITGSGGGTCSLYSGSSGTYTKVGRFVTMNFQLQISSISGVSGGVQISGLPFTSASGTTNQFFNCPIYFLTMASNPNNTIVCQSASASTTYNVYEYNNTTIVHDVLPISRMQAGTYVRGTLFMFV